MVIKGEMQMKKSLLAVMLFTAFNANAASSNLISNGSFEAYDVNDNSFAHIASNCTGVPVNCINNTSTWQPSAGAPNEFLEIQNNYSPSVAAPVFNDAQDGVRYAELNPLGQSGITQSFNASVGLGTVSWWSKSRFSGATFPYQVLLNGTSIFNGSASGTDWSQNLLSGLSLLQGTNTLTFNSLFNGITGVGADIGAHIDNISVIQPSVAAIPEPETYAMFLAGLGLLGFAARRRQS